MPPRLSEKTAAISRKGLIGTERLRYKYLNSTKIKALPSISYWKYKVIFKINLQSQLNSLLKNILYLCESKKATRPQLRKYMMAMIIMEPNS